jgi:hypothetical protein
MKYGDFSSLVQLGVGLHLGAALLQTYGEFGIASLARAIERMERFFRVPDDERPSSALEEEFRDLESEFEIFRIRLTQEYRWYVWLNSGAALLLVGVLIVIAYKAQDDVSSGWCWTTIAMVALSVGPALTTLLSLSLDVHRQSKPIKTKADDLERRLGKT